ncbi:hypothetical protein C8R47DRAFT_168459 [Mycena vitilis]|nr:hypothetical protein C8R47DRAFT_168459 [Mycena vitilis]
MAGPVTIILDDKKFADITTFTDTMPVPAELSVDTGSYNGSMFVPQGQTSSVWTWEIVFDGTSVSLVGITPPSRYNQTIGLAAVPDNCTACEDGEAQRPYTYPSAAFGGLFYTSGTFPTSGPIFLGLSNANGITIDYALVTAGNTTNLQGQTIIVDDASPEVLWNGNWTAHDNFTLPITGFIPSPEDYERGNRPHETKGFPVNVSSYANTIHQGSNAGDSFTFQFDGTSLLISGITPSSVADGWLLHMDFTLDGNTTTKVFTPETTDNDVKPNFVYFDVRLDAATGNHTLVARISGIAGSPLPAARIDYITYSPSFVTIADKPKFPALAPSAAGRSSASTSTETPLSTSSAAMASIRHRRSVGAIIGGVLGGCLLITLLAGTFYVVRRRRARRRDVFAPEPFDSSVTPDMCERNGRSKGEPPSVDANAIAERRNNLAAEIQHLQESRHGEEDEQTMDDRMRALQAQMDTLTHHLVPPSYVTA